MSSCVHDGRRSCSSPGGSVDALERPAPANRLAGKSPAASRMASPPPTVAHNLHSLILAFSFLFPFSGTTILFPVRASIASSIHNQPASPIHYPSSPSALLPRLCSFLLLSTLSSLQTSPRLSSIHPLLRARAASAACFHRLSSSPVASSYSFAQKLSIVPKATPTCAVGWA